MRRHRSKLLPFVLLIAIGCGGGAQTAAPEDAGETVAPTQDAAGAEAVTVMVADSELGEILVDGEGRTLYLFTPDEQGESTCYDDCAANWPALTGAAEAGEGADAALLASVERDDGTSQVTYNDWPLYYFAADTAPGDVKGQGVGDVWYVLDAAGEQVAQAAPPQEEMVDY